MDVRIEELRSADEPGFGAVVGLYQAEDAERDPGDPEPTAAFVASDLFGGPPDRTRLVWVGLVGGGPAGYAVASYRTPLGDHRVVEVEIYVAAPFRQRGVATALLRTIVPELTDRGLGSVIAYTCSDLTPGPAAAMCAGLGMTKRQEERCSRAQVTDIDTGMLGRWERTARDRAAGYRIEQWVGPVPDGLLEAWCSAAAAMEDAPLDDIETDPETRGPREQREADGSLTARGFRPYRTLALGPGGDPAGITEAWVHRERPELAYQGDTGVLAGHRGLGIGRWLKAANYRLLRAAEPELRVIETYNAESNPWMLAINVAMGFRPHHRYDAYQAPIETLAAALRPAQRSASPAPGRYG